MQKVNTAEERVEKQNVLPAMPKGSTNTLLGPKIGPQNNFLKSTQQSFSSGSQSQIVNNTAHKKFVTLNGPAL